MAALPTPSAATSAVELQKALDANLSRLRSAQTYAAALRKSEDLDAAFELADTLERIDRLLDERIALRARR